MFVAKCATSLFTKVQRRRHAVPTPFLIHHVPIILFIPHILMLFFGEFFCLLLEVLDVVLASIYLASICLELFPPILTCQPDTYIFSRYEQVQN